MLLNVLFVLVVKLVRRSNMSEWYRRPTGGFLKTNPGQKLPVPLQVSHFPDLLWHRTKMTELVTDEEGKLIYNSDALSIDLYQPLFYLIAPIAFLLFLWQISPSSSYLGHFASRFFDIDQFDSLDYGSTGGGGGYGLSSGLHFFIILRIQPAVNIWKSHHRSRKCLCKAAREVGSPRGENKIHERLTCMGGMEDFKKCLWVKNGRQGKGTEMV